MAPNVVTVAENDIVEEVTSLERNKETAWRNIIIISAIHSMAFYGFYLLPSCKSPWKVILLGYAVAVVSTLGSIAGVHRLWSHRSYKAKFPLRVFLMLANCTAFQGDIYWWACTHRIHHKYTDTDADPHNSKRGFFFSHMGWLMTKNHPEVTAKGLSTDCSDILADPVVRFQIKYYWPLSVFMSFIMPTYLTVYLYEENWWTAFFVVGAARYCITLHMTWLINSAAHMYGYRPYDEKISPRENPFLIFMGFGEGFHNYHHAFPWDYSASEWGMKWNWSTAFINLMAKIGQAYDLKRATPEMVKKRQLKTGQRHGSHVYTEH